MFSSKMVAIIMETIQNKKKNILSGMSECVFKDASLIGDTFIKEIVCLIIKQNKLPWIQYTLA